MILLYHKVHPESPTQWWVTVDDFWRQLEQLRRFKVVHLDEYDPADPRQVVITFDGFYECAHTYALPILRRFGFPFEAFIIGQAVGGDNRFDDDGEHPATFATAAQLADVVAAGGRLQWHTSTHRDLSEVDDERAFCSELEVPDELRALDPGGFRWLAYPHGRHNPTVRKLVATRFAGAVGCDEPDGGGRFNLPRLIATGDLRLPSTTVSVVIASYNYGRFAGEAIESVLAQTVPADEVLFIDDGSEDDSSEIASRYEPRGVRVVRNERNLGIVETFNRGVALTSGEYVMILGADNRLRSDYVERCKLALDRDPRAAIAYTNVVLFGPRAEVAFLQAKADPGIRPVPGWSGVYLRDFPPFDQTTAAQLVNANFMHGSSMYRRSAFLEAGGYLGGERPEDHDLFLRMIHLGWAAVLCPEHLLEYRQHSSEQANTQLNLGLELAYLHRQIRDREATIARLEAALADSARLLGGRGFLSRPLAVLSFRIRRALFGDTGGGWRDAVRVGGRYLRWLCSGETMTKLRWSWNRLRASGLRGGFGRAVERFRFDEDSD